MITAADVRDYLRLALRRTEEEMPWRRREHDAAFASGDPRRVRAMLEAIFEIVSWQVAEALHGRTDAEIDALLRASPEWQRRHSEPPPTPTPPARPTRPAPSPPSPPRPPASPSPPTRPQRAAASRLALDAGGWRDASGPLLPVGIHLGDAMSYAVHGHRDEVRRILDDARAAGYRYVRTWHTLGNPDDRDDFWRGRQIGPAFQRDWDARLEQYCRDVVNAGLQLHLAAGGIVGYNDDEDAAIFRTVRDVMTAVGPDHVDLIEGLNEARDTGDADDRDPAELERLIAIVRSHHPNNLYALTAYTGTEDQAILDRYTPSWMSFFYYHASRAGHWYDKVRYVFSIMYEAQEPFSEPLRRFAWNGEGPGPGGLVSVTDYQHELDAEAMALYAAQALLCRQAYTFMSGPGVWLDSEPIASMPGYAEVPRVATWLPARLQQTSTLVHGGARWAGTRVMAAQGDVRCDHAIADDGAFAATIYGPSGSYRLDVERTFRGRVIHPRTGEATDVAKRAGESLAVDFSRGRVLVGQID